MTDLQEKVNNVLDALYEFAVIHETDEWRMAKPLVDSIFREAINESYDEITYALHHVAVLMDAFIEAAPAKVRIEVRGGVADYEVLSGNVEVEFHDYDIEDEWEDEDDDSED